jgi:hypothetical protein
LVKTSPSKPSLSIQLIVLAELFWAVAALLFFLVGGISLVGQSEVPFWYEFGTSLFELVAFLTAAVLCLRNWGSSQIVSGRNVWLFIGLGLFCYFLGGLLFTYWETGLGQKPDVSPGDLLYVPAYILLIIGMFQAVINRRLNLEIWQWGVVCLIALVGSVLAYYVSPATDSKPQSWLMAPAIAQTAPVATPTAKPTAKASPKATAKPTSEVKPAAKPPVSGAVAAPTPGKSPAAASPTPATTPEAKSTAPAWAVAIEQKLAPLKGPLNWYYVASDIFLLIVATILLLAFWGGRFAQSWRLIAAAAFCQYIADIWFKYATGNLPNYQSGGLLEVFWVFSAVLFGIGAALEYDLSSRSRSRTSSRRRAS